MHWRIDLFWSAVAYPAPAGTLAADGLGLAFVDIIVNALSDKKKLTNTTANNHRPNFTFDFDFSV